MRNYSFISSGNKSYWGLFGAATAAVIGSLCCLGPLVLLALGLGGVWAANLTALAPYRPIFIIITLTFLGFAFYSAYRKPKISDCEPGRPCTNPGSKRKRKIIILWVITGLVLGLLIFPYLVPYVFAESREERTPTEQVVLKVGNMTCAACPVTVRKSLTALAGVKEVKVTLNPPEAVVLYDPTAVKVEDLIKATTNAGYPSSVKPKREL